MSAIWRDPQAPLWLSGGPKFSFFDIAEVVQPATQSWQEQREAFRRIEMKLGAVFYQANAIRAWELWQIKKPWWL